MLARSVAFPTGWIKAGQMITVIARIHHLDHNAINAQIHYPNFDFNLFILPHLHLGFTLSLEL